MRNVLYIIAALFFITFTQSAHAGTYHYAQANTQEKALWLANKAANQDALSRGTCYRKATILRVENGVYYARATTANESGSCGRNGYRSPVSPDQFATPPGETAAQPPRASVNVVQFRGNWPAKNKATITITNTGKKGDAAATTTYEILADNVSYGEPLKQLATATVTVQAGETYVQEFHKFGAENWDYKYK